MGRRAVSSSVPQINATPLIDILLVLLIFLILTMPGSTHTTQLESPVARLGELMPEAIQIDVDFDGRAYWNGALIEEESRLEEWLTAAAGRVPQPELRISPDRRAPYEPVVQILAASQRHHLKRIALDPEPTD